MPRFYVLEKMIVGHLVDAETEEEAFDIVNGLTSREFDFTEETKVLSAVRIDTNANWPFDGEDE